MTEVVVEVRLAPGASEADLLGAVEALEAAGALELELADTASPPRAWARLAAPPSPATEGGLRALGEVHIEPLAQMDWNSVAQLGLRAARFGALVIVPPGLPAPDGAELVLEIDSGGAFGSGLHPSTALVLEHLVEAELPEVLLDLGTGTGILALAALRLGVERVVATDIDPEALRVAALNAEKNDLSARLELSSAAPEDLGRQFPLVLANVLAAPLADLAPKLVRALAPGSSLVLSGLQPHQADDVVAAYRNLGLWWTGQREDRGWVSLELRPSW